MKETGYKILQTGDIDVPKSQQEFAIDVLIGLSQNLKWLPTKYIYDSEGTRLFQEIMELPEYYLTRKEKEILKNSKKQFREIVKNEEFNLVELGPGDGKKTKILLKELIEKKLEFHYVPIDISESAVKGLLESLKKEFPGLRTEGLVAEYFTGLSWISNLKRRRNVVLFLGSNIGNFSPPACEIFLASLWNTLNDGDYVFFGFDLRKDIAIMSKAYNDSKGVTADFNLNLIRRINRELNADFDTDEFLFYSCYDVMEGAIQSYLVSRKNQQVFIGELNRLFSFKPWEPIHTESSYKYLMEDIEKMASKNHFEIVENFYDSERYFVDSLWQVKKN